MKNKEIKLFVKNKEIKGFIINEVNGYYIIGTYLGIIHKRKEIIDKQLKKSENL